MKNILKMIKISNYTYLFILLCFLCGYIKNILIIFSICLIHELGHIIFIKLFKYKIIYIELLPFGGYTKIDKIINTSINKDVLISFGGIIFQILLYLFIYIFKNNINIITYTMIIKYNLIIIIFNLIPIHPLDGNNILHLLLEKYISYNLSYKINGIVSIILLIVFIFINYVYHIDNYFIISILIYKTINYYKYYKYLKNRFFLERILYDIDYKKIDNNTRNINNIRKEVLHYFKCNNKYINEKKMIKNVYFYKI